jgi:hypothetical protein
MSFLIFQDFKKGTRSGSSGRATKKRGLIRDAQPAYPRFKRCGRQDTLFFTEFGYRYPKK